MRMFHCDAGHLNCGMSRGCIVLCVNPCRDARLRVRAQIRTYRDLVDSGQRLMETVSWDLHRPWETILPRTTQPEQDRTEVMLDAFHKGRA